VGPRLRYIAERYPAWVTLATIWSLSEATGEHNARADLLGGFVPDQDLTPDGRLAPWMVERYEDVLAFLGGATSTRYDRHLPWLAREFGRLYKPVRKQLRRRGESGGLPGGWDYQSLTVGWIPEELVGGEGHTALAALVGPTGKLARQFRSIVDWNEAKGDDLNRYTFTDASWEAEDWAEQRKRDEMPQGEVVYEWPDGWTVQQLTTEAQLEAEGDAMQHCVGGYDEDRIGLDYRIFSLRDPRGQPHATVEWEPDEDYVVELKGKQNSEPTPAYLHRLVEWRCARSPSRYLRSAKRLPDHGIPEHADGLRQSLLGLYAMIDDTGVYGEPVLIYADGTVVEVSDYHRFLRQIEQMMRAHIDDDDEIAFDQSMLDHMDGIEPGEIGDEEIPAWAEFYVWQECGRVDSPNDQMVEYLRDARPPLDPRRLCPPVAQSPSAVANPIAAAKQRLLA